MSSRRTCCLILSCIETDQTMQQDDGIEQLEAREKCSPPAAFHAVSCNSQQDFCPMFRNAFFLCPKFEWISISVRQRFGKRTPVILEGILAILSWFSFSHFRNLSILSNTMCGTHSTHTPQPTTQNTALHARTHQFPSSACNDEQQITMPRNCSLQPPSWHGEVMTKNSRDPCLAIGTTLSRYLFKTGPENENPPNKKTLTRP